MAVDGRKVTVKGPRGELSTDFHHVDISITHSAEKVRLVTPFQRTLRTPSHYDRAVSNPNPNWTSTSACPLTPTPTLTPTTHHQRFLRVDMWFGNKKQLACLRTVTAHIDNMIKVCVCVCVCTSALLRGAV